MKRLLLGILAAAALTAAVYRGATTRDRADGVAPLLAESALPGASAASSLLTRGEYLAQTADCVACHTVPGSGRPFAGGVAFRLPFGTIYSTNITPDPRQGIGGWSDEEFVRAVRDGIGRQGEHLYPAFPYTSYTLLSRADVLAIKAYLSSLPAVEQPNRRNDLRFPFDQRWAIGLWKAAFFRDRRFARDAERSDEWNRGAYLANALGHCGECHTPRNLAFGLERDRALAGAELTGWRAYNITADANDGIGGWSDAELAAYLKAGFAAGRGAAGGPMGEAVAHSLQYWRDDDLAALIAYLRTVPARTGQPPIAARAVAASVLAFGDGPGVVPAAPTAGGELFAAACASCHRWDGAGRQSRDAALVGTRSVNDPHGVNVTQAILHGAQVHIGDRNVYMPGFAAAYTDTEVAAVANYVIERFGGRPGEVTPADVAARRKL